MKKIAVIVALESEYDFAKSILADKPGISLSMCGMGKVNAAIGATAIIEKNRPDAIISTGLAGAIDRSLHTMDIIVARQVAYHDVWCGEGNEYGQVQGYPRFFDADRELYDKAMSLSVEGLSIKGGLQISGDRFINAEDVPHLRRMYPEALSVDMESGALAQTCHRYGVPFISFRVISDGCDESTYNDFWTKAPENSFKILKSFLDTLL
jgi:adenosylhomocysteine nucleosidase